MTTHTKKERGLINYDLKKEMNFLKEYSIDILMQHNYIFQKHESWKNIY